MSCWRSSIKNSSVYDNCGFDSVDERSIWHLPSLKEWHQAEFDLVICLSESGSAFFVQHAEAAPSALRPLTDHASMATRP